MNVFNRFVINSDIIHEKCKILRSNIAIFLVMGPRNLMDECRGFPSGHTTIIIRKIVKIDPDSPSRTFITMYQTTLLILINAATSNPAPKNIRYN
jgi:hypothetical protein